MTPTTFPKCFNKGERWKYSGKEVCLNRIWNSQPPGHEFYMVTTEPSWWGTRVFEFNAVSLYEKKKKSSGSSYISTFSALIVFLGGGSVRPLILCHGHLTRSRSNIKIAIVRKKKKNRCWGIRVSQTHLVPFEICLFTRQQYNYILLGKGLIWQPKSYNISNGDRNTTRFKTDNKHKG